jgi:F0F1-type ATP synthase assembly protein I
MRERSKRWYAFSLVFQLGISLTVPLVVGIGGGVWLDRQFATSPRFTLLGVIVGLTLSGYSFYCDLLPLLQKDSKERK